MAEQTQPPAPPEDAAALKARRKRWLAIVAGGFAVIGIAYGAYWALALRYFQSTDDAYVSGNIVQITPQISGTVVAIGADDTQFVKAGQMLVQLDQADAKIALDQAEAQLGKTVREVRNLFATSASLQATLEMRQSDLTKANEDFARRERPANSCAISREEQQDARDAVDMATAERQTAQRMAARKRARAVHHTTEHEHE